MFYGRGICNKDKVKLREKSVFVEVVERKTLNDGRIMTGHSGTEVCSLFEDLGIRDYQSF